MPANAKWPDFQLASKLRYFMGSSAPESTQSETTSQLDPAKREQLESAQEGEGDQDLGGEGYTASMAEIDDARVEEMEDVDNYPDEGETADVDVDFGDLEIDIAKRAKSTTSKRKKSKRKSLQHTEIAEDEPTDANQYTTSAPTAAEDDERGPDALEDATTEMDALDLVQAQASQKKKKKRKGSDSVDGKRNKKRKGIEDAHPAAEQTQDETENLDARNNAASPQLGTAIEDDVADADEQLSPSVARARRRSQTGEETRSRENSVPFRAQVAPMAPMAIDSLPQEEASNDQRDTSGDHVDDRDDEEMLNIARQVWREHKSSQHEASNGANETNLDQNATGVNGSGDSAQAEEQPTESPARRRSTRTKVKPVLLVQETKTETPSKKNRQALGELPSPSANTPKPRARAKRATKKQTQQPLQPLEEDAENAEYEEPTARTGDSGNYTQGRFTEAEFDGIARVIEQFRDEYGMTQAEVNQMIQAPGGTTAGDAHARLWYRLFEVCPDRKRQKVINVARKKYHNFVARGTWTPEQDEELSQLIAVHGNKWSEIAGLINRHPEDVRDRYRNYIVCGPYQRKDVWSEEEEQLLSQVVEEAVEAIEEFRKVHPNNPIYKKNIEDIIDWQDISKNMERKRSRLQCITKWKAMQNRLSGKKKDKKSASEKKPASEKKKPRQQLASMHEEEQYRLVLAIQQASVLLDADIPWAKLLDKKFRGQWSLHTQVLLWDRLKQTVPGWESLTVLDVAQHIINEYNRTGGLPEINGSGYDDDEREKEILQQLRFRNRPAPAPTPKSAEFVEDSGAEETGAAENNKADITIDPALMEAPPPSPPKATPKPKKKTYSRKGKSKKATLDIQDPIEDSEPAITLAAADEGEESNLEEAQTPQIMIPKKFMATKGRKEENGVAALPAEPYSDSDMDDMEDLPAKILA
ncbi:myb-like DNA-binding domain-containing protein [Trichoderma breve]|uniref:Myb-like DNA-binding domain-containing protein n=1 Tax=Trichoderma breve TaxID=2034170 RepID=A0A9W9BFX1_9HYPO|nr:myb-like DNA-binding domain-containing protein [Trichoderma breve]KAJ4861737.1 myb-like DNA-binding domain-containing protein [Trichoderma breve]